MLIVSFVWLIVLVGELVYGKSEWLSGLGNAIWVLFLFYFVVRVAAAKNRTLMLKKNWLFLLAIIVSVVRFFPIVRALPAARALTATVGTQVIWIFASADQGMRSLGRALGRRGAGYAFALACVVIFGGAGGIFYFENQSSDLQSIHDFPRALWWTAMQMTNIGSSYEFSSAGGRIICLGVSVFAAGMFGYLTAILATFFIGRDTVDAKPRSREVCTIQDVRDDIAALKVEISGLQPGSPRHEAIEEFKKEARYDI